MINKYILTFENKSLLYFLIIFVSIFVVLLSTPKDTYAGCTYYCGGACTQNWPFQSPDQCIDESYMGCNGGLEWMLPNGQLMYLDSFICRNGVPVHQHLEDQYLKAPR